MSSSAERAQEEIIAGNAASRMGFYGDIPNCHGRARPGSYFAPLATKASLYFGVTQADADAARAIFPNAMLVGSGNPLREQMAFPKFTREQVRERLSIKPDEKLILAAGSKFAGGNIASWMLLHEALACILHGKFRLFLSVHPGDATIRAIDPVNQKALKLYEELAHFCSVPTRVIEKSEISSSDLVPGADLIVDFGGSIGIEGAYQQIPSITLGFDCMWERLEEIQGSRTLELMEEKLTLLGSTNPAKLAEQIEVLLTSAGSSEMRRRQKARYPRPSERGATARKMAETIMALAQ
jgi:hypothetical protein